MGGVTKHEWLTDRSKVVKGKVLQLTKVKKRLLREQWKQYKYINKIYQSLSYKVTYGLTRKGNWQNLYLFKILKAMKSTLVYAHQKFEDKNDYFFLKKPLWIVHVTFWYLCSWISTWRRGRRMLLPCYYLIFV